MTVKHNIIHTTPGDLQLGMMGLWIGDQLQFKHMGANDNELPTEVQREAGILIQPDLIIKTVIVDRHGVSSPSSVVGFRFGCTRCVGSIDLLPDTYDQVDQTYRIGRWR